MDASKLLKRVIIYLPMLFVIIKTKRFLNLRELFTEVAAHCGFFDNSSRKAKNRFGIRGAGKAACDCAARGLRAGRAQGNGHH